MCSEHICCCSPLLSAAHSLLKIIGLGAFAGDAVGVLWRDAVEGCCGDLWGPCCASRPATQSGQGSAA